MGVQERSGSCRTFCCFICFCANLVRCLLCLPEPCFLFMKPDENRLHYFLELIVSYGKGLHNFLHCVRYHLPGGCVVKYLALSHFDRNMLCDGSSGHGGEGTLNPICIGSMPFQNAFSRSLAPLLVRVPRGGPHIYRIPLSDWCPDRRRC